MISVDRVPEVTVFLVFVESVSARVKDGFPPAQE
jgi:hypothetical protein